MYILLLRRVSRCRNSRHGASRYLVVQSSELRAPPRDCVSHAEVIGGCISHIEQRLDTRRVLGGLDWN